jgi:multicomponent Na+:H+ antiporter subunit E
MLLLLVVLAAAWLLWSGLYKPLLLYLGAFSCFLSFWLARRMGYFDDQLFAMRFSLRLLGYWFWLGREIIRSSLQVTRIVLDPKLPISPRLVEVKAGSDHAVDQVILGNSITLTPGTLTIDLHYGLLKVHALTETGANDLVSGEMNRRVTALRDA